MATAAGAVATGSAPALEANARGDAWHFAFGPASCESASAMLLYHFPTSPFARRVRLVLAMKGLTAELRDARANPAYRDEVDRLNPFHTVPVLVDGARVIADSTAIIPYLDRKVPDPPLLHAGLDGAGAFELAAFADNAVTILIDLGMRYHPLATAPAFAAVKEVLLGRAERALQALSTKVSERATASGFLCGDRWSFADMAVFTVVEWLEGLPVRAMTQAPPRQVVELGWTLPRPLSVWADRHRTRPDVLALDAGT